MVQTAAKPLKVFIFSDDAMGHINPCADFGKSLQDRGHQIFFLLNENYSGLVTKKHGIQEILLKTNDKPEGNGTVKNMQKALGQRLMNSGMLASVSPIEKLKSTPKSVMTFMESIYDSLMEFNPQIDAAIKREKPDLIIFDHFMIAPAIPQSDIPFVYLNSGSPLGLYGSDKLPPLGAGYSTKSDPATWQEFIEVKKKIFLGNLADFQGKLNQAFGFKPLEADLALTRGTNKKSKYLNIYGYPEELDYDDIVPMPGLCARMDSFCNLNTSAEPYQLPDRLTKKSPSDKLIYLSLGSMGAVNVPLMKRIVSVLAKTSYKYIVSKGPMAEQYDLPDNCWGEAYLPQTRILPLVDLVMTHGGNNTTVESLAYGKPMIVFPLFSDQYDNGQRVYEKGFGIKMDTYTFTDEQLIEAIDRVLADEQMTQQAQAASQRIKASKSKELVCEKVEKLVEDFRNGKL